MYIYIYIYKISNFYLTGSCDFIIEVKNIKNVPENNIFLAMDVYSLYKHIAKSKLWKLL